MKAHVAALSGENDKGREEERDETQRRDRRQELLLVELLLSEQDEGTPCP